MARHLLRPLHHAALEHVVLTVECIEFAEEPQSFDLVVIISTELLHGERDLIGFQLGQPNTAYWQQAQCFLRILWLKKGVLQLMQPDITLAIV